MTAGAALIVIAYGDRQLLVNLLDSLATHRDAALLREIIVVDNGFPDASDSRGVVRPPGLEIPLQFIQNPARSYSSGVNRGVADARAPIVLVSNNDILWRPEFSIAPLLTALEADSRAAIAGPQLVFPDGRWQRSHGPFPSVCTRLREVLLWDVAANYFASRRFRPDSTPAPRRVGYIDGAFFAVQRARFDELGGFDESYSFYAEDVEFSWQARARGYAGLFVPAARIVHVRGATSAPASNPVYLTRQHQAMIRFVARHQGIYPALLYRQLTRLHAKELALLYRAASAILRSPGMQRREAIARLSARALEALPEDPFASGPA